MRSLQTPGPAGAMLVLSAIVAAGCSNTPLNLSDFARGPAPLRMPSPAKEAGTCHCYEDSLTGGQIFEMYCNYCHNAPSLAERPFSNFQNVMTHMRVRANLTGEEYAKLLEFLRRWHDIPPPEQREAPSPKRFFFGQPIPELRRDQAKTATDPVSGPRPAASSEVSPGQPPPGDAPREAR